MDYLHLAFLIKCVNYNLQRLVLLIISINNGKFIYLSLLFILIMGFIDNIDKTFLNFPQLRNSRYADIFKFLKVNIVGSRDI